VKCNQGDPESAKRKSNGSQGHKVDVTRRGLWGQDMLYNIVYCRRCGQKHSVSAEYVRPKMECTKCKLQFRLPGGLKQVSLCGPRRSAYLYISRN